MVKLKVFLKIKPAVDASVSSAIPPFIFCLAQFSFAQNNISFSVPIITLAKSF